MLITLGLLKCCSSLLVNRTHFHGKADFSTKENKIAVCFKLGQPPANCQCTQSLVQSINSFDLGVGEA